MPASRGSSVVSSDPRSRSGHRDTGKGHKSQPKPASDRAERSEQDTLAWISRAVCGFGRYPSKRPEGLVVDSSGAFSVRNLMEVWGNEHNLSESLIIQAVNENLFHDDKRGRKGEGQAPQLRFSIDSDDAGVRIRVNPSRRKEKASRPITTPSHGGERRGRSFDDGWEEDFHRGSRGRGKAWGNSWSSSRKDTWSNSRNDSWNSSHDGRKRQRRSWSRDASEAHQDWASSRPAPPQGLEKVQLPLPMDKPAQAAVACLHAGCRLRAHSSGGYDGFCCKRCLWAHNAGKPPEHGRMCEGVPLDEEPDEDMERDSDVSPTRIVEFIDWILDVGYIEFDICKEEGQWLCINDLLSKLQDRQPQFGVHSVDRLRQVLAAHVTDYEFTEDNKWLRKVDSEERRDPPCDTGIWHKAIVPVETPVANEDPLSRRALTLPTKAEQRNERAVARRPPPPPPTDGKDAGHWKRFQDGDHCWWHYKGPCGEWWCPDGSSKVRPYTVNAEQQ